MSRIEYGISALHFLTVEGGRQAWTERVDVRTGTLESHRKHAAWMIGSGNGREAKVVIRRVTPWVAVDALATTGDARTDAEAKLDRLTREGACDRDVVHEDRDATLQVDADERHIVRGSE